MGVVTRSRALVGGHEIALKRIPADLMQASKKERTLEEVVVHSRVTKAKVPCVSRLVSHHIEKDGSLVLAIEFLDGQDLAGRRLREEDTRRVLFSILTGLSGCHRLGVIHRDMKPENVILTNDGRTRIIDFGVALDTNRGDKRFGYGHWHMGTLRTTAPEGIMCPCSVHSQSTYAHSYGPALDVWATGVTAAELYLGESPFKYGACTCCLGPRPRVLPQPFSNIRDAQLAYEIHHVPFADRIANHQEKWAGLSADGKELILSLLERDPSRRPSAEEALRHRWFAGLANPGADTPLPPVISIWRDLYRKAAEDAAATAEALSADVSMDCNGSTDACLKTAEENDDEDLEQRGHEASHKRRRAMDETEA